MASPEKIQTSMPPLDGERKPYTRPAIILDQDLEARAGSPIPPGKQVDPLQLDGG
jgi:hypothetical protein